MTFQFKKSHLWHPKSTPSQTSLSSNSPNSKSPNSISLSPTAAWLFGFGLLAGGQWLCQSQSVLAEPQKEVEVANQKGEKPALFRQENLMAWCIVPFDGKKRGPVERAEMLEELKLKLYAYDYRAEHVPTFEQEIEETKKRGIEISAWWFPLHLNDEAKSTLALFKKTKITPQLWVMGGGDVAMSPEQETAFIASEVARLRPIADAAEEVGCKVALYNHGAWFGQPENMIKLVKAIDRENVGIVYNLHHAHDQLHRLPEVLAMLKPYLLTLNVNGMQTDGENAGKKILVIGQGDRDVEAFQAILDSGYDGPIGILNHTDEDAYTRLKANIEGLKTLVPKLKNR